MIKINNLYHAFSDKYVLENVNIEIKDGTVTGIVGINGAGKSTLLRLMSGVYVPRCGSVEFDGVSPSEPAVRQNLFFLPDDPYYTAGATAKSVVEMYKTFYPDFDMKAYVDYMEKCKLDTKKPLRNFSKGMKRQFYIAVSLAVKPKYLLLDEAFDGLDPLSRKRFKDEIVKCADENGTTVIITSHSLRELEGFCDSFILIDNKTVKSSGDIAEKVGSFCKFQLAFFEEPGDIFTSVPTASVHKNGKFVQVVFECDRETAEKYIESLPTRPAVYEEMEMDFEEAFITEVERGENNA